MQKLQQEGEKSLAAPVKKFGYWNMDLALRLSVGGKRFWLSGIARPLGRPF